MYFDNSTFSPSFRLLPALLSQFATAFGFSCRNGDFSTLKCYHFTSLKCVEYCYISAVAVRLCLISSSRVDFMGIRSGKHTCCQLLTKQVEKSYLVNLIVEACRMVSKTHIIWQILLLFVTICNNIKFHVKTWGK